MIAKLKLNFIGTFSTAFLPAKIMSRPGIINPNPIHVKPEGIDSLLNKWSRQLDIKGSITSEIPIIAAGNIIWVNTLVIKNPNPKRMET